MQYIATLMLWSDCLFHTFGFEWVSVLYMIRPHKGTNFLVCSTTTPSG